MVNYCIRLYPNLTAKVFDILLSNEKLVLIISINNVNNL